MYMMEHFTVMSSVSFDCIALFSVTHDDKPISPHTAILIGGAMLVCNLQIIYMISWIQHSREYLLSQIMVVVSHWVLYFVPEISPVRPNSLLVAGEVLQMPAMLSICVKFLCAQIFSIDNISSESVQTEEQVLTAIASRL